MRKFAILFFILCLAGMARAQQVAIGTNALMWAALTPNLSCELVTGERTSLDLSVFGHVKPYGIDSKLAAFQPEFRYWFNGRPMVREYIGVSALLASYRVVHHRVLNDGDAIGIGLTFGYAIPLRKRFNIQFYSGFGAAFYRQKQHAASLPDDDRANARGYKLMPAKLGISLSYILK